MNTPSDDAFDRSVQRAHAASLDALSPRVQARLAQRRRAALAAADGSPRRPARWGWAGAAATACVLVIAVQLRPPVAPDVRNAPAAPIAAAPAAPADPAGVLAEDPDFYLWLATEPQAYAME